jgi:hypothetical protein
LQTATNDSAGSKLGFLLALEGRGNDRADFGDVPRKLRANLDRLAHPPLTFRADLTHVRYFAST